MLRLLPRSRCHCVLKRFARSAFTSDPLTESKGQFYYVIPEIPTDSAQNNPLLDFTNLPKLDAIKAEQIFTGVSKQIIEYQVALSQLSEAIKSGEVPITFDNIVTRIDQIVFPVQYLIEFLENLGTTNNDPTWRLLTGRVAIKFMRAQSEHLYGNVVIYNALHQVLLQLDPNDRLRRGVVEQLLAEGWSNGAGLACAAAGKAASCKSCETPHYPQKGSKSASHKALSQLFYLRAELMKSEAAFEQMVTNSAFVSTPDALSRASITGRYDTASRIGPQLPNYLTNVLNPQNSGQIPVAESDLSASAPHWFPYALGGKQEGGYFKGMRVNLGMEKTAQLFLSHCSNRELRKTVWSALVQRASLRLFGGSSGQHAANEERIEAQRSLRAQVATALGEPNWLAVVWRRGAPGGRGPASPDELVDTVLEPIRRRLLPLGRLEWRLLNEWAEPNLRISPSLEHFDIAYAVEQYNFNMSVAPGYSVVTDPRNQRLLSGGTVERICTHLGALFGLSVSRLPPGTGHASHFGIPHADVYEVCDAADGTKLGEILVDVTPKDQQGPAYFDNTTALPLVTRFPVAAKSPSAVAADVSIAGLFGNLPQDAVRIGLTEKEALDIASGFARCLQHVVGRGPSYGFTSGLNTLMPGAGVGGSTSGVPVRDNAFLTQDLVRLLLIRSTPLRRHVFGGGVEEEETSSSVEEATADVMNRRVVTNSIHGLSRIMALPFLRSLYESRFDLELWGTSAVAGSNRLRWKTWHALAESLWTQHLPYAPHPDDQWPCSASILFGSRGIPALRYFEVWRQVIALDAVAAFTEAGFDRQWDAPQVRDLFARYRSTVLDPGTALSCRSVFRDFRGRDPLPEALLKTFDTSHKLLQGSSALVGSVGAAGGIPRPVVTPTK